MMGIASSMLQHHRSVSDLGSFFVAHSSRSNRAAAGARGSPFSIGGVARDSLLPIGIRPGVGRRAGAIAASPAGVRPTAAGFRDEEEERRMNRIVRNRLVMAVAVRDFSRTHPSADANYVLVLDLLEEKVDRMMQLGEQERAGQLTRRASSARRRAVRRKLHHELLRHLVTVAGLADVDKPGLAELFQLPNGNWSNEMFRAAARKMLEEGQAHGELLTKYGLAERLFEDLAAALTDFEASVTESNQGRREHVGARAELKAISDEVMRLVEMLDGLNRYRFSGNAELLAAWESARNVVSGPRPTGDVAEAPKAQGDVKPAA
jgi:hypothetical protein